jgi:hypothetical protein
MQRSNEKHLKSAQSKASTDMVLTSDISKVRFPVHSHMLKIYTGLLSNEHPEEVKVPFSERAISIFLGFLYDPLSGNCSKYIEYELPECKLPECMEMADYLDCAYFIRFAEGAVKEKACRMPYGLAKTWLNLAEKRDLKSLRAACIARLTTILSEYLDDRATMMTLVLDVLASVSSKTTAREIIGTDFSDSSSLQTSFALPTVPEYSTLPDDHITHVMKGWLCDVKSGSEFDDEFEFKACGLTLGVVISWWDDGELDMRIILKETDNKDNEFMGKRFRVKLGLYDFVSKCTDRKSSIATCTCIKVDDVLYDMLDVCWIMNKDFFTFNVNSRGELAVVVCVQSIL